MLLTFGVAILFPGGVFVAATITQWYVSCINLLTGMRMKCLLDVFHCTVLSSHFKSDLFVVLALFRSVVLHFLGVLLFNFKNRGKLTLILCFVEYVVVEHCFFS